MKDRRLDESVITDYSSRRSPPLNSAELFNIVFCAGGGSERLRSATLGVVRAKNSPSQNVVLEGRGAKRAAARSLSHAPNARTIL